MPTGAAARTEKGRGNPVNRLRRRWSASLRVWTPLLMLAAVLSAAAGGGCGNKTDTTGTGDGAATPATAGGGTNAAANPSGSGDGKKLVIAWAEWEPAKQLEKLTKDFTQETGIPVEVQQIPWDSFETEIKKTWSAQGSNYDLIIGDSQWLGRGATAGHYVDLTDWAKENLPIADIAPAALKNYGEYPPGSGKIYGVPVHGRRHGVRVPQRPFRRPGQQVGVPGAV
jgi:multiple sugar transport system substrate-binding protein